LEEPLKILIVDDEPDARELLKYILQEQDDLVVTGMAANVDEAVEQWKDSSPDLVFLDIQMPGKDGFQFIDAVNELGHEPGIIFVTAFDNYAIQAIRNSVFDYIMKPVRQEELFQAISRFRKRNNQGQVHGLTDLISALRHQEPGKMKLNTRSGYSLINPSDILYCKADGNYTHIQLINGNYELTTQNLGSVESLLQHGSFFRVSRSYLVNIKYLSRVDRKTSQCFLEAGEERCAIKIPPQKIRLLESTFN
jgi:DNA-binding LytR/AlgR family response regulator